MHRERCQVHKPASRFGERRGCVSAFRDAAGDRSELLASIEATSDMSARRRVRNTLGPAVSGHCDGVVDSSGRSHQARQTILKATVNRGSILDLFEEIRAAFPALRMDLQQ